MPEHMENSLTLLKSSSDQLLSLHPSELSESFHALESSILPFAKNHPWHTISFLAYFKFNLEKIIQNLQNSGHSISEVVNFNNPLIIEKLLKLETFDLLPNNPDAYLEIYCDSDLGQIVQKGGLEHLVQTRAYFAMLQDLSDAINEQLAQL